MGTVRSRPAQPPYKDHPTRQAPRRAPAWAAKALILCGVFFMVLAAAGILLINRVSLAGLAGAIASQDSSGPLRVGTRMDDFSLPDLDGKPVKLSDYAGRWVLINAWATWCPPCQAEMPYFEALYQNHQVSGFVVLAVNAGESRDQAAAFANQLGLTFPILLDQNERLMDSLAIHDYPTSILVDGNGIIQAIHVGMFTPEALQREIEPLLK
jgi:peroxiredoxin